jgi:alpha-tubulin suppressor-like RCC1 family protein
MGGYFAQARKTDGTLWAWGCNNLGQLGDGTSSSKCSPVQIPGNAWNAFVTGGRHTLARKT